jgi:ACS family allantoate permease-like MFS transporter
MSLDEKYSNKELQRNEEHVTSKQVDEAAALAGKDIVIDPAEANRVRRKIDWHLLPLMCREYFGSSRY